MSDLVLPRDWAAAVFGRDDVREYPESHAGPTHILTGPDFVRQPGSGPEVDVTPAPIYRTRGAQWVDIVFGRASLPGLTPYSFRAGRYREGELLVASLAFLDAVTLPVDFTSDEIQAVAAATTAFAAGSLLHNAYGTLSGKRFWLSRLSLPEAARRYSWEDLSRPNEPIAMITSLPSNGGVPVLDRGSLTILAAARASGLLEVPVRVLYV